MWITVVLATRATEGPGFNELFKETEKLRLEVKPHQGHLSKSTFSKSIKELIKIGALIKTPSAKHSQAHIFNLAEPIFDKIRKLYTEMSKLQFSHIQETNEIISNVSPKAAVVFMGSLSFEHIMSSFKFVIDEPDFSGDGLRMMLSTLGLLGRAFSNQGYKRKEEYIEAIVELNNKWIQFLNTEYPDTFDEILKFRNRNLR